MSIEDMPRLLPAAAMGRRLGVDPRWLVAELKAGRLPGVVAGRTALFEPAAVEQILVLRATKAHTTSLPGYDRRKAKQLEEEAR